MTILALRAYKSHGLTLIPIPIHDGWHGPYNVRVARWHEGRPRLTGK